MCHKVNSRCDSVNSCQLWQCPILVLRACTCDVTNWLWRQVIRAKKIDVTGACLPFIAAVAACVTKLLAVIAFYFLLVALFAYLYILIIVDISVRYKMYQCKCCSCIFLNPRKKKEFWSFCSKRISCPNKRSYIHSWMYICNKLKDHNPLLWYICSSWV